MFHISIPSYRGSGGRGANCTPRALRATEGRRSLRTATLGLFVLVGSSSSCALLRQVQFERPTLELESIEVLALGLSGGSLRLWLNVYNPNSYDLRTTRVEATLQLEDSHFGDVALSERIDLPATERTRVAVPFNFSWEGVGRGAQALLERGSVRYSLDAMLRLEAAGAGRNLNFSRTGEVPVREMMPE